MTQDLGASGKPDRAAGLRPQPPTASSQSSIPSAWKAGPLKGRDVLVSFWATPDQADSIDKVAREIKLSRAQTLRYLAQLGMNQYRAGTAEAKRLLGRAGGRA